MIVLCERQFGYGDVTPSLERLVVTLFVTCAGRSIPSELPGAWETLVCILIRLSQISGMASSLSLAPVSSAKRRSVSHFVRTVVIISDAMRYEVGQELLARMQDDPKCTSAKLDVLLGVLPSYTQLGMAALLP